MTEQADAAVESSDEPSDGPTDESAHRWASEPDDSTTTDGDEPEATDDAALTEPSSAEPTSAEPTSAEPTSAEPTSAEPMSVEPVSGKAPSDEAGVDGLVVGESAPLETATDATGADADAESADAVEPDEPVEPDETAEPTYQRLDCTGESLAEAAEAARAALERGECVVLPTDTVYGIGADAFAAEAVQRLLDAKQRGRNMPPPVLIADARLVKAFSSEVPQAATDLMATHWPGAADGHPDRAQQSQRRPG